MKTIKPYKFSREINGVQVKPLHESGMEVKIRYNGILSGSETAPLIMHYGFGDSTEWRQTGDISMEKTLEGWETDIKMEDKQLNFCFHDFSYNWDNNNGYNWIYRIS
ncbi:MAG: hypothetical protein ACOY31_01265 [Bacillota bacterium]